MASSYCSLPILPLAGEDHVRCIWLHIWRTDKSDIEKNLRRHGITFSEEFETGQPIAILQRKTEQNIDLIRETFTTAQKSQGIDAARIKTKYKIIDTEINNLTDQYRRCNVEVYKDRFDCMLWIAGKSDTINMTKRILGNEPVEVSQCLRVPDLLLAGAGKKIDDDEKSIQIQLNGQEKACILIFDLLSAEVFRRPCISVSSNRCPFNVQLRVKPQDMVGSVEKDVRRLLFEFQTKLCSEYLSFSDEEFTFLSNQEVFSYINSKVNLATERIDVVWYQEGNRLLVTSKDRGNSALASQRIKDAVKFESFFVPAQEFSSNNVHEALKAIEDRANGKVEVRLSSDCKVLNVIRTSDMISVEKKIQDLCYGKKVYLVQSNTETYRAVFRQMKTILDKNFRVDLTEEETSRYYNWVLRGIIENVMKAKEKVEAFIHTLATEYKQYISDEDKTTIKLKLADIRDLEGLSAVMTEDVSKDVNNDSSAEIDVRMAVPIYSWKLVCGGEIMILYCDVKRNPWLLKECVLVDVVPVEGIPTTTFIDVKPLKDFHVTRLFIPYWADSKNNEKNVLESCIVSLLQTVSSRNFRSVSFVLSDVEKVNWPISKYLKTILAVILKRKPTLPIRLCTSAINVCDECTTIIDSVLIKNDEADTSPLLKIFVVRGELAKQETDVIVNSTNTHLKLSQGAVSGSILKHAGNGIQTECDRIIQSRGYLRPSEVVKTGAYKLKCRVVFHGTLPFWQKGSQKILEKFLENCLCEAENLRYSSIAFPALGTGKLGFPLDIVADTMLTSVERFARERSTRYLQDVSFVIYQEDHEVIQVFEREEKIRREKLSAVCHTEHIIKPPICAKVKVTVTAESTQAVQDIFKRIEDNLKCETKQEVVIPEDMFDTPAIQKEPADQTMDRELEMQDAHESPVTPIRELGSSTSGETAESAKSSESDKGNTSTQRNKEICFVELRLVDSNTSSPYEIFRKTVLKYGLEEDHLIWNELDETVARIKFLNEDDAKAFVKGTRGESCYVISIRSPDAVVNIKARLTSSSIDFLRSQEIQRQLVTQSGVGILMDQNEPVELFGDLTSITLARDLLRHWMSNISKVKTEEEQNFLHSMGSVGRGKTSSDLDDEKSETQYQPSVVDQHSMSFSVHNEFSGTTQDNYKQSPTHENQSNQCTLRQNSGSESKSLENTDSLEHSFEMIEHAPPSDEHHSREDHDLKTKKDKTATDFSSSAKTDSGAYPKQAPKYDLRKKSPTQEEYDDIDLKDSLMLTTKEEINVYVYKADICRLQSIDCIVSSTNEDMKNSFGISKAIKNAAGRKMTEECQKYLATHDDKLSRDSVCVTASGNLSNFQRILHVQAPIWRNDMKEEDFSRSLSSTVNMCLHQANKEKMTSIALPAISSGHGGAPRAARFKAYTDGVLEYSKKYGKKEKLKEIHFVDINQDVVDCIRGGFLYAVPEKETAYFSKAMKSILPKKVVEMFKSNIRANDQAGKDLKYFFMDKKVIVVACDGGLMYTLKHTHMDSVLCLEGIGEFKKKATAVVITEDLKFSGNSKSSMVCKKRGGSSFLKNYKSIKKTKVSKNVCGILGGDDLPFQHVFCVLMPNLEQDALRKHSHQQTKFFQDFAVCCQNLLQEADKAGIEHLSMPILGPDDYNKHEKWFSKLCITNMMNEIRNYALARVKKKFIILHIVTDGKDDVFHIIDQEMSEWKRNW